MFNKSKNYDRRVESLKIVAMETNISYVVEDFGML